MTTTSVPDVQFTTTGLVLPLESDILAGVQADISTAFGGGVNPALNTPQGQLASSLTAIIGDKNNLFAQYVNQIDPATASGSMQDAIGRIYFLSRNPAIPTAVQCDCVGAVGTVIPVGAQAQDTAGNRYIATAGGTISITGTISLPFACTVSGPTPCPAGTLTKIYQAIPGWNTVNNPGNGVPGALVESRADFEYRRKQSVALNAVGSLPSIYASVFSVPNVIDVYCAQNRTDSPVTIGSVTLAAHSVYVAASGGDPNAVALAIWNKASQGCNFNGNTSVVVSDNSGYSAPVPTYTVLYQAPAALPIYIAISVQNQSGLTNASVAALITAAVLGAFVGSDGGKRARIGSVIYASRFYSAVGGVAALAVVSIFVGTSASPTGNSVSVGIDAAPTLVAGNVSVTFV